MGRGARLAGRSARAAPALVVPTPAGERFTQAVARDLAAREHLVFACGRYEGIDQRVVDDAAARFEVRELSLGDYVLNGGEVAALAICEAVVRLLPGFMGNAESLVEESHEDGLLEAPVYTKPASWRGLDVPPVLLSGDHGAIARWRHEQSVRRTATRRPDLLSPSVLREDVVVRRVEPGDAGELFTLQRACWLQEEQANPGVPIPALAESLDDVRGWLTEGTVLVARSHGRLVGAVRAVLRDGEWHVGRLMVAPDLQGSGLGRALLEAVEAEAPAEATAYALFTGAGSKRNQRMYKKAGYRLSGSPSPGVVSMVKRRISDAEADLWQTCASAQSAEGSPRTNEPGDLRRAPATGGADAAGYRHCLGLGHQLHTASIRG